MAKTKRKEKQATAEAKEAQDEWEFGGPAGAAFIMAFSVFLCYWLWLSCVARDGAPFLPYTPLSSCWQEIKAHLKDAMPTATTAVVYLAHVLIQTLLYPVLPGPDIYGYPVPEEGNKRLKYKCNALAAWWLSLLVMALATSGCMCAGKGPLPLLWIAENWGSLLTTSAIFANIFCIMLHVHTVRSGKAVRMSGNVIYDFFMGAALNPRIGDIDLKMLAEIRVSWITLFFLTCGAAAKQIEQDGYISGPMLTLLIAHFLYSNACMKGEACVPTTFDIFYEKDGWMLIFWNLTGVPFVYTWNSFYALYHYGGGKHETFGWPYYICLIMVLLAAYYVWDTSQSQRNHFRMQWNNSGAQGIERPWAVPKLPWRTLKNPQWIETKTGKPLLISGFCGMARKIHYTMDIIMAFIWGLACGFDSPLPYYYVTFFTSFIIFRESRDRKRCERQYGEDWKEYERRVPYVWFPGII